MVGIRIGLLGSLHHSDSLFPKSHFFLWFKHFEITAHELEKKFTLLDMCSWMLLVYLCCNVMFLLLPVQFHVYIYLHISLYVHRYVLYIYIYIYAWVYTYIIYTYIRFIDIDTYMIYMCLNIYIYIYIYICIGTYI